MTGGDTASAAGVDWERLDKRRFFLTGAGLFTSLTTALYPLTVIKTRLMALDGAPRGVQGALYTARSISRADGVRGFYKGFGVVVSGMIPARLVYLSTLEWTKSAAAGALTRMDVNEAAAAGAASFVAGGLASMCSQLVWVPIDVVSQRLMIQGGGAEGGAAWAGAAGSSTSSSSSRAGSGAGASSSGQRRGGFATAAPRVTSGVQLARQIVSQEGFRGLYRGFGASVAVYMPSSAVWWSSYGVWQAVLWQQLDRGAPRQSRSEGEVVGVQVVAGIATGLSSAALTNPLDVVKTRLQTRVGGPATWRGVVAHLVREEGLAGFYRGVAPRMLNTAIWGTSMVSAYEFLKRLCVLPPEPKPA